MVRITFLALFRFHLIRQVLVTDVVAGLFVRVIVTRFIMYLLCILVIEDMLAEVAVWDVDVLDVLDQLLELHVV